MVDELENNEVEEEEEASEETPSKSVTINLKTILIGAGAFVVFIAIFSFVLGVFSTPPPVIVEDDHTAADSSSQATKPEDGHEDGDPNKWHSEYMGEEFADENAIHSDSTMTEEDSVAQVVWYVAQKSEIATEWAKLRTEAVRVKQLKLEYQDILHRIEGREQINVVNMAKLFETMKADEVANIMANLPDGKIGLILQKMKKQSASKVLASLPSKRAAEITLGLIDLDGKY